MDKLQLSGMFAWIKQLEDSDPELAAMIASEGVRLPPESSRQAAKRLAEARRKKLEANWTPTEPQGSDP